MARSNRCLTIASLQRIVYRVCAPADACEVPFGVASLLKLNPAADPTDARTN
jgi:hypothetical protein